MRPVDLTGRKFTRLKVIKFLRKKPTTKVYLCRCSCGNTKEVQASNLVSGHVKSCGCLNSEMAAQRKRTHGLSRTPEYVAYCNAKKRCNNPNVERYPAYGGRGIKFLFTSFPQFYKELGPRPKPWYSVDRKNVNGHYTPGNVRWATPLQQRHNQRTA